MLGFTFINQFAQVVNTGQHMHKGWHRYTQLEYVKDTTQIS